MKILLVALFFGALTLATPVLAGTPITTDEVLQRCPAPSQPALKDKPQPKTTVAEGVIAKRSKRSVVVTLKTQPAVGSKAELLKHFDAGFMRGWLSIAAVEVTKVKGAKVTLKILEEKSVTKVNGKKVNHFKKGNKIKLKW